MAKEQEEIICYSFTVFTSDLVFLANIKESLKYLSSENVHYGVIIQMVKSPQGSNWQMLSVLRRTAFSPYPRFQRGENVMRLLAVSMLV